MPLGALTRRSSFNIVSSLELDDFVSNILVYILTKVAKRWENFLCEAITLNRGAKRPMFPGPLFSKADVGASSSDGNFCPQNVFTVAKSQF